MRVKEQSMEPSFREGDFVLVNKLSYLFAAPKVGHVVVAKHPHNSKMLLLKRIAKESKDRYWLKGDSSLVSRDSRQFGWVKKPFLVGKVIHKTAP